MANTKAPNAFVTFILRHLVKLLGFLPLKLRAVLGRMCGSIAALLPLRENKVAALQMDLLVPESGGRANLSAMFAGIGQSVFECFNIEPLLNQHERYVTTRDEQLLKGMLSSGRGILVLASHLSNWDLMAAYLVRRGFKVSAVGKEANNLLLQPVLEQVRTNSKMETIWRSDPSASLKIYKKLRKGEMVGTLLDQDTDVPSTFVPFFGIPAKSPVGMIEIAKRAGARIATYLLVRTGFQHYELRIKEFDSSKSVEEILAGYHLTLEATIREFPSQWMWVHKRWRSRPNQAALRTSEYIRYLEELLREKREKNAGRV